MNIFNAGTPQEIQEFHEQLGASTAVCYAIQLFPIQLCYAIKINKIVTQIRKHTIAKKCN